MIKKISLFLVVMTNLYGCSTLNGAYVFDKRTHWARQETSESQRLTIMDRLRPLAENVLACDSLFKIVLEDFNTHESDFKSNWSESWRFFGCGKATYFTVQYFRVAESSRGSLSYRILNGASCSGNLRTIDGYTCAKSDTYYRTKPELREKTIL